MANVQWAGVFQSLDEKVIVSSERALYQVELQMQIAERTGNLEYWALEDVQDRMSLM